ncbi:hypothetical protein [Pseudomonas sp. NA-150]|uniref:hypothetical protein n=1 Tax=Pseudomonas sp. NA-150 TaxID=3367525 RepID=UPI0037C98FB1
MKGKKSSSTTIMWWVWGGLDAMYLLWYVGNSLYHGRAPYFSDLLSTLPLLQEQGTAQILITLMSWLLQLSVIASCVLFLTKSNVAKWVAYFQLPLRLFFFIPSISIVLIGAKIAPNYNHVLMLALLILSELMKGVTLWGRSFKAGESSS